MALNQREKLLLALPVVVGGVLLFYNRVHEPLFARRAAAAEQSTQVKADLSKDQTRLSREGDLNTRRLGVTTREKLIDSWVPGKNSAGLFIWYLSQAELHSGARIKGVAVVERKEVTATSAPAAAPPGGTAANAPAAAPPGSTAATAPPAAKQVDPTATKLMVIRLSIKVDAKFPSHLLFNQELEQFPLFLNTGAFSITRAPNPTSLSEQAGKLIDQGNPWLATQVLSSSPGLDGIYQVNLYFKGEKVGPTTEPMRFGENAGRLDPFAMDNVTDFIKAVTDFYSGQDQGAGGPVSGGQMG